MYAPLRRTAGAIALACLLFPVSFPAQPVVIPDSTLPQFQSQDLQAPEDQLSQQEWEAEAARLRAEYFAEWEAQAQLELDNLFGGTPLPADAFVNQGGYGDYLATSQQFDLESGAAQFEISAEMEMALRRESFMAALMQARTSTNANEREEILRSMKSLLGSSTEYLEERTKAAMDAKAREFSTRTEEELARGLGEYSGALAGLDASRADFYEQLDLAEQKFADGLDRIDAYEATVRTGIEGSIPGLEAYLADNDQFYETTCDASNVCTADRSRITAAGAELAALIDQMKQALQTNAPVSSLAQQMAEYLERQEQAALTRETYWESQIVRAGDRLGGEAMAGGGQARQEGILVAATWADTLAAHAAGYRHTDPAKQAMLENPGTVPGAILRLLQQGDSSYLEALLKPADHFVVENLSGVDLCGGGNAAPAPGIFAGLLNKDGCVSSDGLFGALGYTVLGFIPLPAGIVPLFSIREEEQWILRGSYTLRDTNAEHNRDLWRGYKGDLGAQVSLWRNDLLPAIQNWETQAAQYRADYSAWQVEADQKRNEFNTNYNASVQTVLLNRQQFLERTSQEIESGKRELAVIAKKAQDMQNSQEDEARIAAEIKKSTVNAGHVRTSPFPSSPLPGLSQDFLSRAKDGPTASRSAEDLARSFQSSLRGSLYTTVQNQNHDDAKKTAELGVSELKSMLGAAAGRASTAEVNASLISGYIGYFNERANKATPLFEIALKKVGYIDAAALSTSDEQFRALARELGVSISASGSLSESEQNTVLEAAAARKKEKLSDARTQTEKSLNEYRDRMSWKNAEVLADGRIRATRSIATGASRLKAGGDATRTEDYEMIYEDQVFYLSGPGAVQLAGGAAGLFDENFNLNKIAEENAKHQEEYQKRLQESANRMAAKQADADELSGQMYATAQNGIAAQADLASKLQDLAVTVLSGGTLGSWLKSQVQGLMGQAFEDLTGFPAGILSNLMGGMRLDKAITQGITDRAKQMAFAEIDKATGLSGAGAFMMEKFEKSQASKKSHASQRGLNALNPANFQHTTLGKAMMNSNNPLVTAAAAGMTGNPMMLNVALMQTANMAMPDGMRTKVANTMDKAGRWMEDNNGLIAKAAAATAIAAGSPPTMAAAGMGAFVAGGTKAIGDVLRSTSRVVATGSQSIAEAQDAMHTRNDANVQNALETGKQRHEERMKKYEQMTLGTGIQELMSPVTELAKVLSKPMPQKSDAQVEFETSLATAWSDVAGWPKEFTRSMFVDGANMEEAISAQAYGNLNAVIPGAAQEVQEYLARRDLKNKRGKASKIKPEDFATGGLTYAWRNAEYNKDGAIALQVAETTAAVAVNVVPGAGQAMSGAVFAYMAGKQVYQGSLHGGTKGALAGAVSGAISGLAGMNAPITGGFTYDFDRGWGANVGLNVTHSSNVSAGGSLNFQEGEGYTGAGLNMGYQGKTGYGGTLGASVDRYGAFNGASISGSYRSESMGFAGKDSTGIGEGKLGIRIGADGKYAGVDVSYTNTIERALDNKYANPLRTFFGNTASGHGSTSYVIGGGLSFNNDQSYSVNSILGVGLTDEYRAGIDGFSANQNSSVLFDRDGRFTGTSTSIQLDTRFRTMDSAKQAIAESKNLSEAEKKKLLGQLDGQAAKLKYAHENREAMRLALADECGGPCSNEELDAILAGANPDVSLNDAIHKTAMMKEALKIEEKTAESRENFLAKAVGFVGDGIDALFLNKYSDEAGYVDAGGGYVPRTCFTRDTLVAVDRNAEGSFERNGKYYKFIQDVRAGDLVWSYNEKTQSLQLSRVKQTFVRQTDRVYTLTYDSGTRVETTGDHPFMIEGAGWRDARLLRAGDDSLLAREISPLDVYGGMRITPVSWGQQPRGVLVSVSSERRGATVYNFEVEGTHTYLVTEDGVVVHNAPSVGYAAELEALMAERATEVAMPFNMMDPHRGAGPGGAPGGMRGSATGGVPATGRPPALPAPVTSNQLRGTPGLATGGTSLPRITGQWLRGSAGNAGRIPGQVGEVLSGRTFQSMGEFRSEFWRAVAKDPVLSRQFSPANRATMGGGQAPFVPMSQRLGGQTRYIIHHDTPISQGGAVFDLRNMSIVTPRFHQELLSKSYHSGN